MVSSSSKNAVFLLPITPPTISQPGLLPFSLVLRLSALRILWLLRWSRVPPLRPALHRNRLASSTSFHHVLNVRSVFDVLVEFADVAADVFVGLDAKGDNRNKTKREPFPSLIDACAVVTAVLALCGDVLVAFEERGESYVS